MSDVQSFISAIKTAHPNFTTFSRKELIDFADKSGIKHSVVWGVIKSVPSVKRGIYDLSATVTQLRPVQPVEQPKIVLSDEGTYVPKRLHTYVKWGHYRDITTIIDSKMFYPVYLTGLSGNGKTMMVEQACAEANREFIRVQITPETDEDDLIGGFRLVNGETVFSKGPVIKAMEAGAILLIDEIDRGSNKLMALQGVLEGKPVLIKKTGELVTPASGFNIIATSNTKGKGSEDGRFIAATIIDEAFLERFTITMEQPYPAAVVEKKIVVKHMELYGNVDNDFADNLTKWSGAIRKTFEDGGVEEIISTRRLCHIAQTFSIFKDRKKAIELCVARFDEDTRAAFVDLYTKIDAAALAPSGKSHITTNPDDDYRNDSPF
jgi:MoxR-like ATPase